MPSREYRLQFDEALMLAAVRTYVLREIGWVFIAVLAGIAAFVGYLVATGDRSWMLGVTAATLGFGVVASAMLYRTHQRRVRDTVRRLDGSDVVLRVEHDGIHYASVLGTTMLAWGDVARLTRTPHCWLLHLRQGSYATLPTRSLDDAALQFIEARVRAAGGRV